MDPDPAGGASGDRISRLSAAILRTSGRRDPKQRSARAVREGRQTGESSGKRMIPVKTTKCG